jgi:hypothetical protein
MNGLCLKHGIHIVYSMFYKGMFDFSGERLQSFAKKSPSSLFIYAKIVITTIHWEGL